MAVLSASTSMREYPVKVTEPGRSDADASVSGLAMSRTVSSCVPRSSLTASPGRAPSITDCRRDFAAASITYAFGVHCGSAYTAPVLASSPRLEAWLLVEARPTRSCVSASITATRGFAKSWSDAYRSLRSPSSAMSLIWLWARLLP